MKYCNECEMLIENKNWYLEYGRGVPKKDQRIPNYCLMCGNRLITLSPMQSKSKISQKKLLTREDQNSR